MISSNYGMRTVVKDHHRQFAKERNHLALRSAQNNTVAKKLKAMFKRSK